MQQANLTNELNKWFAYVQYGQYQNIVYGQAQEFLMANTTFASCVESMQLPGEQAPSNLLMFKGTIRAGNPAESFKVKIILVNGYPFRPPKVYIDQQLNAQVIKDKNYLFTSNEIKIPYLNGWNMSQQPTIAKMFTFIKSVIESDPPVPSDIQKSMYGGGLNSVGGYAQAQPAYGQQQQPQQQRTTSTNWQGQVYGQEQQQQPSNQDSQYQMKDQIFNQIDGHALNAVRQGEAGIQGLIKIKTKLINDQRLMEDQGEEIKEQLQSLQTNNTILNQQVQNTQTDINKAQGNNMSIENLDNIVTVQDPFSEKIIQVVAKYNALEDCMGAVKKGFEKEAIDLQSFLKAIRQLSMKQCKQITKMQKIRGAIDPNARQSNPQNQFRAYQM